MKAERAQYSLHASVSPFTPSGAWVKHMVRNSCAIIYLDIVQFLLAAYPRQFIEIY
jgi:hypothetical protein